MIIHVGDLSGDITEEDIRGAFETYGEVASVELVRDEASGEAAEHALVDIPDPVEAHLALNGMEGAQIRGRAVTVREASPPG